MLLYFHLELLQIDIKLLGCLIDRSNFVDSLNALGRETKAHFASELFRKVSLPLQIDLLDLFDTLVTKGNHSSAAVGRLSQQIAGTGPHFHGSCTISLLRPLYSKTKK